MKPGCLVNQDPFWNVIRIRRTISTPTLIIIKPLGYHATNAKNRKIGDNRISITLVIKIKNDDKENLKSTHTFNSIVFPNVTKLEMKKKNVGPRR